MRYLNILIVVAVGLIGYGATLLMDYTSGPSVQIITAPISVARDVANELAPDFAFEDIQGRKVSMSDFEGKVVILNFWASWCPPCVKEFPDLLRAANSYKDDVVLIALSSDYEREKMMRFVNKMKKDSDIQKNVFIAFDENGAITNALFGTYKLPETYIIDQKQNIVFKLIGADWSLESLNKKIADLI